LNLPKLFFRATPQRRHNSLAFLAPRYSKVLNLPKLFSRNAATPQHLFSLFSLFGLLISAYYIHFNPILSICQLHAVWKASRVIVSALPYMILSGVSVGR